LYELAIRFIDNDECEEVIRLRMELLTKKEQHEKLCNLIGWCLRSEQYSDDIEMMAEHFILLHRLDRIDEILQRVSMIVQFLQCWSLTERNCSVKQT